MQNRRVVITGLGMVSPLGLSVPANWEAILAGKSGISTIEHFDASEHSTKICGRIKDFDPAKYFEVKEIRKNARFTQLGLAASVEAMEDSQLDLNRENLDRIGVVVGSGIGGLGVITDNYQKMLDGGPRKVSPFFIPSGIINMVAGVISIRYGLCGPNISIVTACTTGTHCIGTAARLIAYGDADVMLAGGTESSTGPLAVAGFSATRALSKRNDEPTKASRPWDKDRDGFVLSEGAGVVVLETYEHAKARGAKMYAEIIGFGSSADASHITLPDESGMGAYKSMHYALQDAGINPQQIDYVNAHGTSTKVNDHVETLATKRLFGDHAYKLAVSSTKSMTGHLLGAAGAVEAIYSVLAIRDQVAPPTINLDHPDEGFDLNYVAHTAQQRAINCVMSNSFGFGGTNGTLVFSKVA